MGKDDGLYRYYQNLNTVKDMIKNQPNTELQLHIKGSLEPELMIRLAKKNNVDIPYDSVEDVRVAYNFNNLQSFFRYLLCRRECLAD